MYVMYAAIAGIFVGFITDRFWFAFVVIVLAMPAAWLFNIRCYQCSWPAYRTFGDPAGWRGQDSLFARAVTQLPSQCPRCQAAFTEGPAGTATELPS
jgi:hypothetical protein